MAIWRAQSWSWLMRKDQTEGEEDQTTSLPLAYNKVELIIFLVRSCQAKYHKINDWRCKNHMVYPPRASADLEVRNKSFFFCMATNQAPHPLISGPSIMATVAPSTYYIVHIADDGSYFPSIKTGSPLERTLDPWFQMEVTWMMGWSKSPKWRSITFHFSLNDWWRNYFPHQSKPWILGFKYFRAYNIQEIKSEASYFCFAR